ncbi:WXG100 family type VII secretion target [Nocardia sp. GAS34]|uniref:WXG100 family type VII secretion target n=1 Tax=unclassified Nocardia TaxID=2637762 RepID=UPI003D19E5C4
MNDDLMQYSAAHINELLGNLDKHHGDLQTTHGDAHDAHAKIMGVWNGTGAEAYAAAFAKYVKAHENVMHVLKSGRGGVEQAHINTTHADNGVGQMFGA